MINHFRFRANISSQVAHIGPRRKISSKIFFLSISSLRLSQEIRFRCVNSTDAAAYGNDKRTLPRTGMIKEKSFLSSTVGGESRHVTQ